MQQTLHGGGASARNEKLYADGAAATACDESS